jgi:two-component system NtrC family sensor kinase
MPHYRFICLIDCDKYLTFNPRNNVSPLKPIMPSILGKIILAYLALAVGVAGFVLFTSADLRFLESRVREAVAITAFQDDAQEMRRHEKNFLLYQAPSELTAARGLAKGLAGRVTSDGEVLARVLPGEELAAMSAAIVVYRSLLDPPGLDASDTQAARVREAGHAISEASDRLAERERGLLIETLRQSRQALIWTLGLVALLALAGGQLLWGAAGRPLRRLEAQLKPLAEGRFQVFAEVSRDREIVSFTAALNRMLEELESRRRQVLHAQRLAALGTLASGVAHELNNPLGNISGACQILLEEVAELPGLSREARADLRGWLTQIDDETERARRIVLNLLDYSRKPGRADLTSHLGTTLDRSLLLLGQRLPAGDNLSRDIPPGLWVRMDPQRLQQVFLNLIQNALDAGARQVRIEARLARDWDWPPVGAALVVGEGLGPEVGATEGGERVEPGVLIRVADDGAGIPPDRIDRILDPFYTTRQPGEGSGLGLYIVSEIIREQEGAIAVSSPPEGGACFALRLAGGDTNE